MKALTLLSSAAMLPLVAAAADTPLRVGMWEIRNDLIESVIDGQSHPGFRGHAVQRCLLPADAARGPGLAFSDPNQCVARTSSIDASHYDYVLECKTESGDGTITTEVNGTYSADQYDGTTLSLQKTAGRVVKMRGKIIARRVSDCPAT